jgi:hypothetical protein
VHEYASREFTFRVTVGAIYHLSSTPIPGKFIRFLFFQSKKKNLVSPTDAVQEPIAEQETWIFTGDLILFMQR